MGRLEDKRCKALRRKKRVRKKISGTAERPRLTVHKSLRNIRVQVIDDSKGHTLAAVSTLGKQNDSMNRSVDGGKIIGKAIAENLLSKNINRVVFDRNGSRYHGIVKAVAEGARENGLEF